VLIDDSEVNRRGTRRSDSDSETKDVRTAGRVSRANADGNEPDREDRDGEGCDPLVSARRILFLTLFGMFGDMGQVFVVAGCGPVVMPGGNGQRSEDRRHDTEEQRECEEEAVRPRQ